MYECDWVFISFLVGMLLIVGVVSWVGEAMDWIGPEHGGVALEGVGSFICHDYNATFLDWEDDMLFCRNSDGVIRQIDFSKKCTCDCWR